MDVFDCISLRDDRGVGSKFCSADGITFGLNDGSEMSYFYGFFNVLNDGKAVGSFLNELI